MIILVPFFCNIKHFFYHKLIFNVLSLPLSPFLICISKIFLVLQLPFLISSVLITANSNSSTVDAMFSALSDCQMLHPDSDCQLSDEDFEDADEEEEHGAGDAIMQAVGQMDGEIIS